MRDDGLTAEEANGKWCWCWTSPHGAREPAASDQNHFCLR